jgi:hypothetical protein
MKVIMPQVRFVEDFAEAVQVLLGSPTPAYVYDLDSDAVLEYTPKVGYKLTSTKPRVR